MTNSKSKTFFQFFFGILLDLCALSFLGYQLFCQIKLESTAASASSTQVLQLQNEKDPQLQLILDIFDSIETDKIQQALTLCYQLAKEDKVPEKIIEYFADFYEYYGILQNPKTNNYSEVSTDTFIKNSHYLIEYFKGTKYQENALTFCEVIPYYLIKNFNATQKKQELQYPLYSDYVHILIDQEQFLSTKGADVVCLYINSRYYNINIKYNSELKLLINEIDYFCDTYSNQVGSNGTYRQQRDYLQNVRSYLITQINAPFRLKPKWNKDFPKYNFYF